MACAAYGCTNRPSKKIKGISFHRFPKNDAMKFQWIRAVRRKNWQPSARSLLCSEHFEESDFDRSSTMRVYLKQDAVPSIFKAYPEYLQKMTFTRKDICRKESKAPEQFQEEISDCCLEINSNLSQDVVPEIENIPCSVSFEEGEVLKLKRKLEESEAAVEFYKKEIKLLHQTNRRNEKKIKSLEYLLMECKNKGYFSEEALQTLSKAAVL